MGIVELDPFTGERRIPREHPLLKSEATFEHTLEVVKKLRATRVILTHVEEADQLTHDDLHELAGRLAERGLPVEFAHDTLLVNV
jgi:phosphoribosyl 1,2-cyclic phosphate phosphodiesterase